MKSNKYLRAFGKLHYFVHIGIVAFIVGVLGSLVSYLFETLIILSRNIFFYGRFDLINVPGELNRSIWGIGIILVPVAGSFIVTFLGSNLDKSQRGLSVPELMYTIRFKLGGVNPLVAILKTISAAITIGSGGSVGRTGPVLSMGAAISWLISSIVRLTSRDKVIVLAAGSAAIIAAIFNTPIAGVVFAVELLLARVTSAALFVIIIAAFSASYFEYMYIDLLPILKLTVEHESLNKLIRLDLMFYCFVLGVIVSFVSAFFIKGIYFFEEFFKNHFTNRYLRHAFGMFLVGLMVYFFIRNFGSYYIDEINFETIQSLIHGLITNPWLLLLLIFGKLFATFFTLSSGGSGGILAPCLFMGAVTGMLVNIGCTYISPTIFEMSIIFILAGAAGMFAATTGAMFTAAILVVEMTQQYILILPVAITVVAATYFRKKICNKDIYTLKLANRGIEI